MTETSSPSNIVQAHRFSSGSVLISDHTSLPLPTEVSTSSQSPPIQISGDASPHGLLSTSTFLTKSVAHNGISNILTGLSDSQNPGPRFLKSAQPPRTGPGLFDKSKLKSAFASALTPKPRSLPSPLSKSTTEQAAPTSLSEGLGDIPLQSALNVSAFTASGESKCELGTFTANLIPAAPSPIAVSASQVAKSFESRPRQTRSYVLPSGETVSSGKGLGRGRPGIKRGPRKAKKLAGISQARTISRKRKRSLTDIEELRTRVTRSVSTTTEESVGEAGDEYSPQATQTRSGRQTHRPATFVPPESPAQKRVSKKPAVTLTDTIFKKRRGCKAKEQTALCEHCLRGYGPQMNVIVFCDGCDRCWHQRCHDPPIARKIVLDFSSHWFCKKCATLDWRRTKEVRKPALGNYDSTTKVGSDSRTSSLQALTTNEPPQSRRSTVGATSDFVDAPDTSVQATRRQYFSTLSKSRLVELVSEASALAPDLSIWPATAPLHLEPGHLTSTRPTNRDAIPDPRLAAKAEPHYDGATNKGDDFEFGAEDVTEADEDRRKDDADDDDDILADEHARLYPRPGRGIRLPPESEDLDVLLEDEDCATFSHRVISVLA